jgi:hypothetical protein
MEIGPIEDEIFFPFMPADWKPVGIPDILFFRDCCYLDRGIETANTQHIVFILAGRFRLNQFGRRPLYLGPGDVIISGPNFALKSDEESAIASCLITPVTP